MVVSELSSSGKKPQGMGSVKNNAGNRLNTEVAVANSEAFNMTMVSESIGVLENSNKFHGGPNGMLEMPDNVNQFSMSNQSFS